MMLVICKYYFVSNTQNELDWGETLESRGTVALVAQE